MSMMGGRLLVMVVAMLAASLAAPGEEATYLPPIPLIPEGDNFYFEIDPSDPVYSSMFAKGRYVTPMIPEDTRLARSTARNTCPDQDWPVMCGTYSLSAGQCITFSSPYYDLPYSSNFRCSWTFEAAGDEEELELSCSDFLLARRYDSLKIDSDGSGPVTYKAKNSPPTTTTVGGVLKAEFVSNRRYNAKGFKCVVRNIASSTTTTTATSSTTDITTSSSTTTERNGPPLSHPRCGLHNIRIVNGVETTPNEYPWQVWVVTFWTDGRGASCGGSIINEQWVLTAAHCISKRDSDGSVVPVRSITVTVGAHLKQNPSSHGGYTVQAVVPPSAHANYNFPSHDIALLRLTSSLTFTQTVGPVCLPPRSWSTEDFVNSNITMSGWGVTESGSSSSYLRHTHTTGYPIASCRAVYGALDSTVLCTDGSAVKKVCSGDSGGPVTVPESGRRFLVGVVSFTGGCTSTRPDGHGRVAYFIDWIESVTGINFGL